MHTMMVLMKATLHFFLVLSRFQRHRAPDICTHCSGTMYSVKVMSILQLFVLLFGMCGHAILSKHRYSCSDIKSVACST